MVRSDDALRRITHERLHAVAQAGGTRPGRVPPGPAAGGDERVAGPRHRASAGTADAIGPSADDVEDAPAGEWPASPAFAASTDHGRPTPPWSAATPAPRHASQASPVLEARAGSARSSPPTSRTAGDDARDVVERMRREALAEVAAQYSSRHGHPLEHPGVDAERGRRRWFLTVRHAVVAGVAVAVLTAGVVVRATAEVPETVPAEGSRPVSGSASVHAPGGDASAPGSTTGPDAMPGRPDAGSDTAGAPLGTAGPPLAAGPGAGGAVESTTAAPAGGVVVHVVGQVHTPGLVELPAGSRVGDAVAAAGGVTDAADLSGVNLARVLVDGEQVVVPAPGEAPATIPAPGAGPPAGGRPGTAGERGVVDLNAAGLAELDALPGIGPVIAQRILDWRADNGPFRDVAELGEVAGIGDTLLGRLRPLVVV